MGRGKIFENVEFIYIYIYCHPQTDCFVVSQLFSVARHVRRLNLGSKPAQVYVCVNELCLKYKNLRYPYLDSNQKWMKHDIFLQHPEIKHLHLNVFRKSKLFFYFLLSTRCKYTITTINARYALCEINI